MSLPRETLEKAKDVHSEEPVVRLKLDRVGSFGLRVPVEVNGLIILAEADVWVSLPETRRGVDLSRQVEALYRVSDPPRAPEKLVHELVKLLLDLLPYADSSGASLRFDVFQPDSRTFYRAEVSSKLERDGRMLNGTRVELTGMTACPCTMELIRAHYGFEDEFGATHTQRSTGILEVISKSEHLDHRKLANLIERAMSSPLRTLTKRPEEAGLVLSSLMNPKLAEDVLREMIRLLLIDFPAIEDDATIFAAVRSFESVHMHDIYAEIRSSFRELRLEFSSFPEQSQ